VLPAAEGHGQAPDAHVEAPQGREAQAASLGRVLGDPVHRFGNRAVTLLVERLGHPDSRRAVESPSARVNETLDSEISCFLKKVERADEVHLGDAPRLARVALGARRDGGHVNDLLDLVLPKKSFE